MSWLKETAERHFITHPKEEFMKYFGGVFQVVYANTYTRGTTTYSYYILKPHPKPSERYGLGEIIALYVPFYEIQARDIDALIDLQQNVHSKRVHQVWNILITQNTDPINSLDMLTRDKDLEVYSIPFAVQELESKPDVEFINTRLRKYIQERDLFDAQSALRSKMFFFGRDDLVNRLIAAVEKGQNFGLFGLRKVGKTSLLYALEMYLERVKTHTIIHIDCQTPAIYLKKWGALLAYICQRLSGEQLQYQGDAAVAQRFDEEIKRHSKRILLIFDEIENISFGGLSPSNHWDNDFLPFWGAIRAAHQDGKLTFGVAGVNPKIFETPLVRGLDNPFLLGVTNVEVDFLEEVDIKTMVRTIGNYMGLEVEGAIYPWLYRQYGGHPLLTRKACSLVYNKTKRTNGNSLLLENFTARQEWLDQQLGQDVLNILVVLMRHYPNEFEHLLSIAEGDSELFEFLNSDSELSSELRHILNYKIIKAGKDGKPIFVIEALRRFLLTSGETAKQAVKALSDSSQPTSYETLPEPHQLSLWTRLSLARNQVEPKLRQLIMRALLFKYGEKRALTRVLDNFSTEKQADLAGYNLTEIFGGSSKALYLRDLKSLINRDWELFQHVFSNDRKAFEIRMDKLNSDGRADAHATNISDREVAQVELIADELIKQITPYLS